MEKQHFFNKKRLLFSKRAYMINISVKNNILYRYFWSKSTKLSTGNRINLVLLSMKQSRVSYISICQPRSLVDKQLGFFGDSKQRIINDREENICFKITVNPSDIQLVHKRHELSVQRSTSHNESLLLIGDKPHGLLNCMGNNCTLITKAMVMSNNNIASFRQWPSR